MNINISNIKVNKNRRAIDKDKVKELADSIQEIGLLNPVTVSKIVYAKPDKQKWIRDNNGSESDWQDQLQNWRDACSVAGYDLIAGAHRIAAYKLLGKTEIKANITSLDGLKAKLAEIDENLIRNELHYTERGDLLLDRKRIYEDLHPETKREATLKQNRSVIITERDIPSFVKDTSSKTGVSENTVEKEIQIAKKLGSDIKETVRKHDIPKTDALKLARMDEEKQRAVVDKIRSGEAKSVVDAQRKVLKENIVSQYEDNPKNKGNKIDIFTIKNKYRIIYADPPWAYGDSRSGQGTTGATDHYPIMPLKDICSLPVKNITDENAVLFLWVTSPLLEECFEVIKAWGFKYKSSFVWDKIKHNMGHYNSVRHELLLICTKGSCVPDNTKLFDSVQSIERTEHSQKPEEFREIIDTLYSKGKKIELFARKSTADWDAWGYEA
jgi:N6-adenosine-specific RNA methylase IME4